MQQAHGVRAKRRLRVPRGSSGDFYRTSTVYDQEFRAPTEATWTVSRCGLFWRGFMGFVGFVGAPRFELLLVLKPL